MLVALLLVSHAIRVKDEAFLDVVLIFAVVAFFGTVALARYLQREIDEPEDKE
jgi:multisubunit Na+/H+ antiporter MnhF subunit